MSVQVHRAGVEHARRLIDNAQYVKDSDWSDAQPSADDENAFIERNGWDAYAEWHLAENPDESEETKARYAFPYGDLRRVHRSALVAAKQRAAQQGYDEVEEAADRLLQDVPGD